MAELYSCSFRKEGRSGEHAARVQQALGRLEPYAWAGGPDQEFTSFHGAAPDLPGVSSGSLAMSDSSWVTWSNRG